MPKYLCPRCGKERSLPDGVYKCRECGVAMQIRPLRAGLDGWVEAARVKSLNSFNRKVGFNPETRSIPLICSWCGAGPKKMTIYYHPSNHLLFLCFMCQHFPEPYRETGLSDEWVRIDPWTKKQELPRLKKSG